MIKHQDERAFPVTMEDGRGQSMTNLGMTLRDYFAAKAMGGMVANVVRGHVSYGNTQELAARSYEIADEMLAERAK